MLREACSWEIIRRIWNQSIPLEKQSQTTEINLAHRNIFFTLHFLKFEPVLKNCEISNVEGLATAYQCPHTATSARVEKWQLLPSVRAGGLQMVFMRSESTCICICNAYKYFFDREWVYNLVSLMLPVNYMVYLFIFWSHLTFFIHIYFG